jgi:hypothetical protein
MTIVSIALAKHHRFAKTKPPPNEVQYSRFIIFNAISTFKRKSKHPSMKYLKIKANELNLAILV